MALSWGSGRRRKVTLIPSPLNRPPKASLGAFPFAVWKNWRGGIHESTPQPRGKNTVKRNSKRRIPRMSLENRRLFTTANLVVRPAWELATWIWFRIPQNIPNVRARWVTVAKTAVRFHHSKFETFRRNTSYMYEVFLEEFLVPGGGPDQLNRCKEAAAVSLLTCRSDCNFISQYNTMGVLPPWSWTSNTETGWKTGTWPDYLVNSVLTKNEGPHPKKFVQNREIVGGWTVRVWEHTDSWLGAQMGSVLKPIQTLKEYLCCHIYCAHLATPWYKIVGTSRIVSDRESRYPHRVLGWNSHIKLSVRYWLLTVTHGNSHDVSSTESAK